MFTRNWYKLVAVTMAGTTGLDTYKTIDGKIREICSQPSLIRYGYNADGNSTPSLRYLRKWYTDSAGVVLGTGTTAPTLDDYAMSGVLVSTYTYSATLKNESDENGITSTALYTITNTGTSAITIGEIGLIADLTTNSSSESYKGLLERTVLENPITIEPGGVGQITYTLRMNYPTA